MVFAPGKPEAGNLAGQGRHFGDYFVNQALERFRGSMQAISREQIKEEIFVVVGNSGCRGPTPVLACWLAHAQASRVEPLSRTTKDKPSPAGVRRCRRCTMARRTCRGIPGSRGH